MSIDFKTKQKREWSLLYDEIKSVLQQFGQEWDFDHNRGDYWLVDDNWGIDQHKVELQNLELLKPVVIKLLKRALARYPDWEIVVAIDIPDKKNVWPAMGLVVRDDEIIDGLQRQFFPEEFQSIEYEGSRPMGSKMGDVIYSSKTRSF